MASIRKESRVMTSEFMALQSKAQQVLENNDCAVRAIAIACDVDYDKARHMLAAEGRKPGRGTYRAQTKRVIQALGYTVTERFVSPFISKYPGRHAQVLRNVTTHHPERFNEVWADGKTYLFFCARHVLAVKNGVNHDWTKGRAKRVIDIWEISK